MHQTAMNGILDLVPLHLSDWKEVLKVNRVDPIDMIRVIGVVRYCLAIAKYVMLDDRSFAKPSQEQVRVLPIDLPIRVEPD